MNSEVTLPNFLVIGAPKCGTTSLYYYLRQHPDVYLPIQKELHYFTYDQLKENSNGPGDSGILSGLCATREEYARHFKLAQNACAIGDISPSYLYYGVHERIKKELHQAKIVVMLRNPVDKAYSQYMHMVRDQHETLSFFEALMAEKKRQSEGWSDIWRYAESSLYADRLQAYIDCFSRENVHVILFENFSKQPQVEVKRLLGFLGLSQEVTINTDETYNRTGESRSKIVANLLGRPNLLKSLVKRITPDAWRIALRLKIMDANTAGKPNIDAGAVDYLRKYFSDDIMKMEFLLGQELSWGK